MGSRKVFGKGCAAYYVRTQDCVSDMGAYDFLNTSRSPELTRKIDWRRLQRTDLGFESLYVF